MDPLFPDLPADLSALSDEEIAAHLTAAEQAVESIIDGTAALPEGTKPADRVALGEQGVAIVEKLRDEQGARALAAEDEENKLAELRKRLTPEPAAATEDEPDDPEKPAEASEGDTAATGDAEPEKPAETVETPEAIAASAAKSEEDERERREAARRRRLPAAGGTHAPTPRDGDHDARGVLTASADLPGFQAGQEIKTNDDLVKAMQARFRGIANIRGGGAGEKYLVASLQTTLPEERTLRSRSSEVENMQKIADVVTPQGALLASGGLCAPVTPYYELMTVSVADRPVRDALARFNADRGGIRFMTPPKLSAFAGAIGRITAAQDAAGGTSALKGCLKVTCPGVNEVDVAAIYRCIQFGNMGSRAFPEQVAQANELVLAAYAQKAETALLDGIAAASTAVTTVSVANGPGGVTSSLLSQLILAATAMRSRHRMDSDRTLRVLLPAWVLDALQVDVLRSQFMRFDNNDATFENQLRQANIEPSWYLDTPTGGGQVFGTQAAATLVAWPSTVISFMFPEGSFLLLDGGTLDIGLVRDSTLNAVNDYQIFAEGFENVAFIGVEALEITHNICPSGETTAAKTAPGTCAA